MPENTKSKIIKFKAIDDDGISYWPEYWPVEALLERKKALGSRIFSYQYQNEPSGGEGNFLNTQWLNYVKRSEIPPRDDMFIVQGIDPSFSERARSDYFIIATLGRDNFGQMYLLDIVHAHAALPQQIDLVRQQFNIWHPSMIVIEGGTGRALYDSIVSTSTLPVTTITTSKRAKEDRIKSMAIPFQNKQILVAGSWDESLDRMAPDTEGIKEFVREWELYPGGRYDDALDATQMALEQLIIEGAGAYVVHDYDDKEPIVVDSATIEITHRVCGEKISVTQLGRTGGRKHYRGNCNVCGYEVKYSVEDKPEFKEPEPVDPKIEQKVRSELGFAASLGSNRRHGAFRRFIP